VFIIYTFSGKYRFLSNFYPCAIRYLQETYPSVEHAYQASKTPDPESKKKILLSKSPAEAKRLGKKVPLYDDWEELKVKIMFELLWRKFSDHPRLKEKLVNTGKVILIEGNNWGDRFWGAVFTDYGLVGNNVLGKLLMMIRKILSTKEKKL